MTNRQRAARIKELAQSTIYGYRVRPHSPKWNEIMRLLGEFADSGTTPPPPSPDPASYAPRAYNLGGGDQDPRFCLFRPDGQLRAGISLIGADHYRDSQGSEYNGDGMNIGGRWRIRTRMVPGLKPADQMDGRAPCEPYAHDGRAVGGSADYPAESYLQ